MEIEYCALIRLNFAVHHLRFTIIKFLYYFINILNLKVTFHALLRFIKAQHSYWSIHHRHPPPSLLMDPTQITKVCKSVLRPLSQLFFNKEKQTKEIYISLINSIYFQILNITLTKSHWLWRCMLGNSREIINRPGVAGAVLQLDGVGPVDNKPSID